jgi:hypothetical protein
MPFNGYAEQISANDNAIQSIKNATTFQLHIIVTGPPLRMPV